MKKIRKSEPPMKAVFQLDLYGNEIAVCPFCGSELETSVCHLCGQRIVEEKED